MGEETILVIVVSPIVFGAEFDTRRRLRSKMLVAGTVMTSSRRSLLRESEEMCFDPAPGAMVRTKINRGTLPLFLFWGSQIKRILKSSWT